MECLCGFGHTAAETYPVWFSRGRRRDTLAHVSLLFQVGHAPGRLPPSPGSLTFNSPMAGGSSPSIPQVTAYGSAGLP
jgi:hypothetical protein